MQDAKINEMILVLHGKVNQILCDDSSSFWDENVKKDVNSKMERFKPHCNNFSTLCLVNIEYDIIEQMENIRDKVQSPYTL